MIMDISKTNFIKLKTINFCNLIFKPGGNNIVSIEQLQFINMELLEDLRLG